MWFDSWADLGRILATGAAAYLSLVVVLRISGKRTLAKLNAFDFVVTVALGSTLATTVLDSATSWADGLTALALLAVLQLVVAWLGSRFPSIRTVVTARPTYLLRHGVVLEEALRAQRVTRTELCQAVRASGTGDLQEVAAVVLETDGTLSVITGSHLGSALADVPTPDQGRV